MDPVQPQKRLGRKNMYLFFHGWVVGARSPAAVGVLLGHATLSAGILIVRANLAALDDVQYVERMSRDLERLEEEGSRMKDKIRARVKQRMCRR